MTRSLIRVALVCAVAGGLAAAAPAQAETCLGTFVCVPADVAPLCLPYHTEPPQTCIAF